MFTKKFKIAAGVAAGVVLLVIIFGSLWNLQRQIDALRVKPVQVVATPAVVSVTPKLVASPKSVASPSSALKPSVTPKKVIVSEKAIPKD